MPFCLVASEYFLWQSLVSKHGVINLLKLLMKPQCPGPCDCSQKGCSPLVTSYLLCLHLLEPAANMLMIQSLPRHSSDLIRGELFLHQQKTILVKLSLRFGLYQVGSFFRQHVISIALCIRFTHYKDLPLLLL